jgi:hypothetical protein
MASLEMAPSTKAMLDRLLAAHDWVLVDIYEGRRVEDCRVCGMRYEYRETQVIGSNELWQYHYFRTFKDEKLTLRDAAWQDRCVPLAPTTTISK